MRLSIASTLSLLGLLIPLWNCSKPAHDPKERYFLIASNIKVGYWQTANKGLLKAAAQLGVKAEMTGPDTYDPAAQKQEFERVVGTKPMGILVSAADARNLQDDIASAIAAGIPVVTVDSDAPGSKRLLFVGTNNFEAGKMGGKQAVKLLNGKGNVVIYTMPGQSNLDDRLKGYKDAFAEHPGIHIVDVVDIKGDPRIAFDTTTELLQKKGSPVDAFLCLEALGGKEVADVLDRSHVSGKVVIAMDTDDGTLEMVKRGVIHSTIAQKPYTMAYVGLQTVADLYARKVKNLDHNWSADPFSIFPAFIDTGTTLIDKSNAADFQQSAKTLDTQ